MEEEKDQSGEVIDATVPFFIREVAAAKPKFEMSASEWLSSERGEKVLADVIAKALTEDRKNKPKLKLIKPDDLKDSETNT